MCNKTDNSCRQEKLGCKGCKHNKRKIIEIYLTEDEESDEFFIDVERCEDTDVSNAIMKKLLYTIAKEM